MLDFPMRPLRILLGLLATLPAVAQSTPLTQQVNTILAAPAVFRAHWGILATTLDGTPLYALNEKQLFRPASNAKLYTTAAALALLGPEATVTTQVIARGSISPDRTALTGDLVLQGAGDANLSARQLPYLSPKDRPHPALPARSPLHHLEEMADTIAATGLKLITGDIVGDDTLYPYEPYPSDWSIDDTVWGYGAPVSALTITDNQLTLTIAPGLTNGALPTVTLNPAQPAYYTLDTSALTTSPAKSGKHIQIDRPLASRILRLYGTIATDAPPEVEEIAIQDPAEYAAFAFRQILESRGMTVKGSARSGHSLATDPAGFLTASSRPAPHSCTARVAPPDEIVLAQHRSVPLAQDVVLTNKVSQNLHAELLLLRLGFCDSSTAAGAAMVRTFLTHEVHLDPDDFLLYDGSGLSGHDLVTPRATARLLAYAATQPWFPIYKQSLPVGGEDGSLASRFPNPPLKGNLQAKTGTLGESRALSGYLTAASGRTVIFSIMVDNHTPRTTADRDAMDRIVQAIAAAN